MDSPEGVRIPGNELSDRYGAFTLGRHQGSNEYYKEAIAVDAEPLRMMRIPAGTFVMGSPDDELSRRDNEGPQHEVSLSQFFMSKYPVTQVQWQAVAAMPAVNRILKTNPSKFKGEQLPVEQVNWYEAVEFCDRLTLHTNRQYRLPTEAEWEYACRAGTIMPFYFGESITTDLANYGGLISYGDGPSAKSRAKTTPVGQFNAPNAYGLCDMHGNVYEWCQDYWHSDYKNAPSDGSAWIESGNANRRVCRGGCWDLSPAHCRSAYRYNFNPEYRLSYFGFRVSCAAPRIFQ